MRTRPLHDVSSVRESLEMTRQAVCVLETEGALPYQSLPDVGAVFGVARAVGGRLDPSQLMTVVSLVELAVHVRRVLAPCENAPRLSSLAGRIPDVTDMAAAIRRAIQPDGEVADEASPRLADIRRRIRAARSALQAILDSFLDDRDNERFLQERLITSRNERYVLVVKSEHRARIPGIIHGASSSGASLFVEPLRIVELNNDVVALVDEEQREIARVLADLTARVHDRLPDLERAFQTLAQLDALQAKAILAGDMRAFAPEISDGLRIALEQARHPLLITELEDGSGVSRRAAVEPVPISIRIEPESPVLVISGPNAGGKTVALKTVGLLALMAQSGLFIPAAAGSVLPVFRTVFADIGDEQSIAADLSTFSAHLTTIIEMTRNLESPALVLLDELGSGTDPSEGGALGVGVIEFFHRAGALVVATTHHEAIKSFSLTAPGVTCAALGFDPDTYKPDFRLSYGAQGRSLAFEMAERLGLPESILIEARSRLSRREVEAIDHLKRMAKQERETIELRARLAEEREELARARAEHAREIEKLESRRRMDMREESERYRRKRDEMLACADDEIRAIVLRLATETTRNPIRAGQRARRAAHDAFSRLDQAIGDEVAVSEPLSAGCISVGDRVRVKTFGVVGSLLGWPSADEAELEIEGKRLRVPREELTRIESSPFQRPRTREGEPPVRRHSPGEANLAGLTVEEALVRLDKLLDDAILADMVELRVVHGTGRLRRAVCALLSDHPHVARIRAALPSEGGAGASIVVLRD
ncbi:MAG: Smr/MutS family protein [Vicinamibacteria bacterium]|nr:Smr/MutS family protein [Vicinamibacteria bacterium]